MIANSFKIQTNILFDEGAQHSLISAEMANELHISPMSQAEIAMTSFGTSSMTHQQLGAAIIEVETLSGERISVSVLIVQTIAAPIQNSITRSQLYPTQLKVRMLQSSRGR